MINPSRLFGSLLGLFAMFGALPLSGASLVVQDLRCEYRHAPLGIDVTQPRLSWVLESNKKSARGQSQSGYRLLVASTRQKLDANQGDLWDSGQVESDQSIQLRYAGKPLVSEQQCFWKIRVWDQDGQPSPWSAPADWSMGLLSPTNWKAHWVGLE